LLGRARRLISSHFREKCNHCDASLPWGARSLGCAIDVGVVRDSSELRDMEDEPVKGPYSLWHHSHSFQPIDGGTLIRDSVRYALPFGLLGRLAHACVVKAELNAIFDYRAKKVSELLEAPVRL
jgi:ligand-binding SRPBCC domain-containing protein